MITKKDASIIKGMLKRGDKQHDIAAWCGINSGRVAEVSTGARWPDAPVAPESELPPSVDEMESFVDGSGDLLLKMKLLAKLIKTALPHSPSVVVRFTPDFAQAILQNYNVKNRDKRPRRIKQYATDMREDAWGLTGDTLKFDALHRLADGQNRLAGCVLSDTPFTSHVVFGIDPGAFPVLDSGVKRTSTDTFKMVGVDYPEIISKAVRWLMILDDSDVHVDRGQTFTNAETFEYFTKSVQDTVLLEQVKRAKNAVSSRILPHALLAALLYRFDRRDPRACAAFVHDMTQMQRGAKKLLTAVNEKRKANAGRVHERTIAALIVLTWHGYCGKGPMISKSSQLKWSETDVFPSIG